MSMTIKTKTPTERIFDELSDLGITDAEFARKMSTTKQNILNWKNRGIPAKHIFRAANIIHKTPEWINTGEDKSEKEHLDLPSFFRKESNADVKETDSLYEVRPEGLNLIPLISWVQAGSWSETVDNYHPGDGIDLIPTTAKTSKNAYALKVSGDSMEPKFSEGSIIIVDPDAYIVNKSYVIAKLEDSQEATFKQYIEEGGKKFLKPVNPRYPLIEINEETIFCGRVIMTQMEV